MKKVGLAAKSNFSKKDEISKRREKGILTSGLVAVSDIFESKGKGLKLKKCKPSSTMLRKWKVSDCNTSEPCSKKVKKNLQSGFCQTASQFSLTMNEDSTAESLSSRTAVEDKLKKSKLKSAFLKKWKVSDCNSSESCLKKVKKNPQSGLCQTVSQFSLTVNKDSTAKSHKRSLTVLEDSPAESPKQPRIKKQRCDLLPEVLENVASATLKLVNSSQTTTTDLFSECIPVLMHIVVFKVPNTPFRHIRCELPHSFLPPNPDVCLIVPDMERGRKTDEELDRVTESYLEMLQEKGVSKIKEVIPFAKLRSEYGPFEMKRRLAKSFDLFLCDGRIQGHTVHFLGKIFEKAKKVPVPIHAIEQTGPETTAFVPNLKDIVDKAIKRVYFSLHNHGASYTVKVGHSLLSEKQLSENIDAIWKKLNTRDFPGGSTNIRAVYLKGPATVGIPLYASLEPLKRVPTAQTPKKKPVKGEISTHLGKQVIVFPTGSIKVLSNPSKEDIAFSKEIDEMDENQKKHRNSKKKSKAHENSSGGNDIDSKLENGSSDHDIGETAETTSEKSMSDDEDVESAEKAYLSGLQH